MQQISEDEIDRLVETFYDRVRQDPLLGPIFDERVEDWPAHMQKLKDFWSSVLNMSGRYYGNPMRVHAAIPDLTERHFTQWLQLFDKTVDEIISEDGRPRVSAMAHRIAHAHRQTLLRHQST